MIIRRYLKLCGKCGKEVEKTLKRQGKIHNLCNRKFCLTCSPFGLHNTRNLNTKLTNKTQQCKICGKIYEKNRRNRLTNKCLSCNAIKRRRDRKLKLILYKGGKCQRCGYNKYPECLTFHHRNVEEKSFNISGRHCYKFESLIKEVDKCDLLCCLCHNEEHAHNKIDFEHLLPEYYI